MAKKATLPSGWIGVKLGDVAKKCTAKNNDFKYSLVLTNSAQRGVIPQTEHFDKDIAVDTNIDVYYVVDDGAFVYNPRTSVTAPCGPIRRNHLGITGVMSPLYTVFQVKTNIIYDAFFEYFLLSSSWHRYIKSIANYGARHDRMSITDTKFFAMPIPLPPIAEQKRIAEILTTQDRLIAAKARLIVAKKKQKKWLIRILLRGHTYVKLKSLCAIFCDGDWIESKDQSNDGIRLIQTGNIGVGQFINKEEKKHYISSKTFQRLNCTSVIAGDVLISRLPAPAGRACIVPTTKERMITAVDCTIVRFIHYNPILFVGYTQTANYQKQIDILLAGSTRQRISRNELGKVKVPVLSSKKQTIIAEQLTAADKEIELLERELEQQRHVKKYLMRQLLTGKIRVKGAKNDD